MTRISYTVAGVLREELAQQTAFEKRERKIKDRIASLQAKLRQVQQAERNRLKQERRKDRERAALARADERRRKQKVGFYNLPPGILHGRPGPVLLANRVIGSYLSSYHLHRLFRGALSGP